MLEYIPFHRNVAKKPIGSPCGPNGGGGRRADDRIFRGNRAPQPDPSSAPRRPELKLCSPECFDFIYLLNDSKFICLHLIPSPFSAGTCSTCILPAISSRTPHMGSLDSDPNLGSHGTSLCCTNSRICQNSRTEIDISRTYRTIFRFCHSSADA